MLYNRGYFSIAALLGIVLGTGCSSSSGQPVAPVEPPIAYQTAQTAADLDAAAKRNYAGMHAALRAERDSSHRLRTASYLDRAAFRSAMDATSSSSAASPTRLLYVSDGDTDTVDIFTYQNNVKVQNQKMIGQITGFESPNGLAVDRAGDLFVCDFYGDTVTEYTPASMPNAALTIPFPYAPTGVAVDDNASNVYVTNDAAFPNGQLGIAAYKKGATTPFAYKTDPTLKETVFPFLDNKGDVYLGYYNGGSTNMGVFLKGSSVLAPFYLTNSVYQGQIDDSGDLIASDSTLGTIDTYPNGTGQSNAHAVTVTNPGGNLIFFDLNRRDTQVFATVLNLPSFAGSPITQYAFPSGTLEDTIKGSGPNYDFGIVSYPDNPMPPPYTGYPSPPPGSTPTAGPSTAPSIAPSSPPGGGGTF